MARGLDTESLKKYIEQAWKGPDGCMKCCKTHELPPEHHTLKNFIEGEETETWHEAARVLEEELEARENNKGTMYIEVEGEDGKKEYVQIDEMDVGEM